METLDVEALIIEIQQCPVIWDVGCNDFSNREKKKNAWEKIFNILIGKEDATGDEKLQDTKLLF